MVGSSRTVGCGGCETSRVTSSELKGAGRAEQAQQLKRECSAQQQVQEKEGLAKSPEKGTTRQPSEVEEEGRERGRWDGRDGTTRFILGTQHTAHSIAADLDRTRTHADPRGGARGMGWPGWVMELAEAVEVEVCASNNPWPPAISPLTRMSRHLLQASGGRTWQAESCEWLLGRH